MPDGRLVEPTRMPSSSPPSATSAPARRSATAGTAPPSIAAASRRPAPSRATSTSVADLERLPILLAKDDERELQERSRAELGHPFGEHLCAPLDEVVGVASTSGTTGTPTFYAFTAADVATTDELWARAFRLAGSAGRHGAARLRPRACSSPAYPWCARSSAWARGRCRSAPRPARSASSASPTSSARACSPARRRTRVPRGAGAEGARPAGVRARDRDHPLRRRARRRAARGARGLAARLRREGLRPARRRARRHVLLLRRRAVRRHARARRGLRDHDPARRPGDEGADPARRRARSASA